MTAFATQSNVQMTAPGLVGRASAGVGKSKLLTASELRGLLGTGGAGLGAKYLADDSTWKTIDLSSYATTAAVAAGYQPLDSDLTSLAALITTAFGRDLLTKADGATVRSYIGAGSSSFDGVYSSLSGIPATFAPAAHNQAWSTIATTPTTLVGYGITDAYPLVGNPSGFLTSVTIADGSITLAKLADMATASVYYRKTAATGVPEVQSLATLKTDLGLTGTNSGDQNVFTTIAVSGQSDVVSDAASDTLTLVAGTNISITTVAGTDTITITNTAAGLSGTGGVDNAVLRADGTGGATLQGSALIINDLATASPNNTVNNLSLTPTGGTTNVSVAIVPKGTGAFCLAVPDNAATGGNARGTNAVDLQTVRTLASQVASGSYSFAVGKSNISSGQGSFSFGEESTSSGRNNFCGGFQSVASGTYEAFAFGERSYAQGSEGSFALGSNCISTQSWAHARGREARADRQGMHAEAAWKFAANGDAQIVRFCLGKKTTDATATTLSLNNASLRLTIPSGKMMFASVRVSGIKSDGSAAACYLRKVAIKNVAGTTSLVGSIDIIGVDVEDNVLTDIAITADDTNDALQINVTGIAAETWRWVAVVDGLEIAYGT